MGAYTSISGVKEVFATSQDTLTLEDWSPKVTLECPWSSRYAVANDLLIGNSGGPRTWPWGFAGGTKFPVVQSVGIKPLATNYTETSDAIDYQYAHIDVSYGTEARELVSESIEPETEHLILDHRRFRWGAANGPILLPDEAPTKQQRSFALKRTIYRLASVNADILTLPGSSNDAEYASALLGLTFPIETLVFGDPDIKRTIRSNGTDGFTVTLTFFYNPNGWNKYYRAKTNAWEEIWDVEGSAVHKNYPPEDYSNWLF